jgi:hypothetical protein
MKKLLTLVLLAVLALVLSCEMDTLLPGSIDSRSAGEVIDTVTVRVAGPLNDIRAVRGKPLDFNAYVSDAREGDIYTLYFGYSPDFMNQTFTLENTYSGFNDAMLVPNDAAETIFFQVQDSRGRIFKAPGGQPYQVSVFDSIVGFDWFRDFSYSDDVEGWLTISYSGPATAEDTMIHFGFDGWQSIEDRSMNVVKDYAYYEMPSYNNITLPVTRDVSEINYVFYGDGIWDNNAGQDYTEGLKPLVYFEAYFSGNGLYGKLSYANGTLIDLYFNEDLFTRYTMDDWSSYADSEIYAAYYKGGFLGFWEKSFNLDVFTRSFETAFYNSSGSWENNDGNNYRFDF